MRGFNRLLTLHTPSENVAPPQRLRLSPSHSNPRSVTEGTTAVKDVEIIGLVVFCGEHPLEVNHTATRGWKLTEVATLLKKEEEEEA